MHWQETWKRRLGRTLIGIGLLSVLTACGGSTPVEPIAPPPSLTAPCPRPVGLPERAMTQVQVETAWGRDRSALRACGEQLDGLAGWIAKDTR